MQPTDTCSCGRRHHSPTETVAIGRGMLERLPEICRVYQRILVVADRHTYAVCGEKAVSMLGARVVAVHVFEDEALIPNEASIAAVAAYLNGEEKVDHILAVGSGVINDICKHAAHTDSLRYTVVATAPSMDGYASSGAALILGGMKVTLPATPPIAIVGDTDVLAAAPMDMIRAGYGDIIGKYSCLCDWRLAALVRGEYICPAVWQWVKETADRVRSMAEAIACRDPAGVEALMQALVDVGVAMAYVGNSRPASGSEHHIAHYLEITGLLRHRPFLAHGVDVACGSILTAALREKILCQAPVLRPFDRDAYVATIREVFGGRGAGESDGIAESVVALQDQMGWYTDGRTEAYVLSHMDEIRALLAEAPSVAESRAMVEAVGLSYNEFVAFYGEDTLCEAVRRGKDLKDRYTVLWLYDRFYE